MNKANYCSNCGLPLDLSGKCSTCNHIDHEAKHSQQCAYTMQGRQCPAPGVLSKSVTGGDRYYCAAHFRATGNTPLCEAIVDDYELNGLPDRRDWRDILIEQHMGGDDDQSSDAA